MKGQVLEDELADCQNESLLGDRGNTEVFVIGAGLLLAKYANAYRSENRMRPIRKFWDQYFKNSNAELMSWGQPALLRKIE